MKKPDIRERVNRTNAYNAERKTQEYDRIKQAISLRHEQEEFEEWKKIMRFEIALSAFQIVRKLEDQRDMNVPQPPDFVWNSLFCEAIRMIPEAKRFAQDCWYDCVEVKM